MPETRPAHPAPVQSPVALSALHEAVQQNVGRFVLIAQRHEFILKALVIDSEVKGTVITAPTNKQERQERFEGNTLGNIIVEFNRSYLREAGDPQPWVDAEVDPGGRPSLHTRFGRALDTDELEATRQRLLAFRDLRNRIVHHLIHDHDLSTREGCEHAIADLDAAREIAKARLEEAEGWARSDAEARGHAVAFFQSDAFQDWLEKAMRHDAAAPAPPSDWATCTLVQLLRREEQHTRPGQMTRLEPAIKAIQASHRDEYPRKYGQKTWLGVLNASQQFKVKRHKGSAEQPGWTDYRSVPPAGQSGALRAVKPRSQSSALGATSPCEAARQPLEPVKSFHSPPNGDLSIDGALLFQGSVEFTQVALVVGPGPGDDDEPQLHRCDLDVDRTDALDRGDARGRLQGRVSKARHGSRGCEADQLNLRMEASDMGARFVEQQGTNVARLVFNDCRWREASQVHLCAVVAQAHRIHPAEEHIARGHQHGLAKFVWGAAWPGNADTQKIHRGGLGAWVCQTVRRKPALLHLVAFGSLLNVDEVHEIAHCHHGISCGERRAKPSPTQRSPGCAPASRTTPSACTRRRRFFHGRKLKHACAAIVARLSTRNSACSIGK